MRPYAIKQTCSNDSLDFASGHRQPLAIGEYCWNRRVALRHSRAGGIHPLRASRRKRAYFAIKSKWLRHATPNMKAYYSGRLWIMGDVTTGKQGFHLTREPKRPTVIRSVERFYSIGIAREKEATLGAVPDCKSEHATQVMDQRRALQSIQVQENLSITMGTKNAPVGLKVPAQLWIV